MKVKPLDGVCVLILASQCVSCATERPPHPSREAPSPIASDREVPSGRIAYGQPTDGVLCGIRMATRSPCRLEVFVRNVGEKERVFSIDRRHFSSWADVFVDGQHYYPAPDTVSANRATMPEEIRIAPGETRQLPWCNIPHPKGHHRIAVKFWLNRSPTTQAPTGPPLFESGELQIDFAQDADAEGTGG